MRRLAVHRPSDLRSARTARDIPTPERPYGSWCSDHRASGQALDLQTPFFRPGSMLMGSDDGGIDDQIFEVRIIGHHPKDALPNTLEAPSTEAPEYAVPVPEHFREVSPRRPGPHDPQYAFNEHPVVSAGRPLLVGPTYDQRRHPLPRRVTQNQTIHHTQGRLPKAALNLSCSSKGIPRI